jgi:hypothetical protein
VVNTPTAISTLCLPPPPPSTSAQTMATVDCCSAVHWLAAEAEADSDACCRAVPVTAPIPLLTRLSLRAVPVTASRSPRPPCSPPPPASTPPSFRDRVRPVELLEQAQNL